MDKKTTLEMIAAISNANGTSGFEDEVVAAIRPYAEGLGEITEDRMRNLYIRRKENNGKRPVVQLDAHSDEVGFMVQAICPNGTLRIIQIGGWVNHNIPAHKVLVRNRFGEYIPGITASKPPHFMTEQERKAPLDMKDITVDVGAVSKEEAVEKFGIRIGEPVVPDVTFTYSETTDLMVGKSFDCRLGCAAILKTMHTLAGEDLNVDIVGACAAQEEVGVRIVIKVVIARAGHVDDFVHAAVEHALQLAVRDAADDDRDEFLAARVAEPARFRAQLE